ncbi:histone deacetylase family protein [Paludisphaera mucosa]|uniref:Histone deacetylase n=1 Tax=Paludisphaera mucosa TaxID=3030827 RepID=A0ABT6FF73_9BACT|nr:histone deacetylase [Paludisphaera mucosa]MDG3006146.1 histone deacetylase [Paludisphaera mucosa]
MVPIVYHPRYNITAFGLERLHPFDGRKYGRIRDALIQRGLRRPNDFIRPAPARRYELAKVHTPDYLGSLWSSNVLAGILEVPAVRRLPWWLIDWRILGPMRLAAGGTIEACRLALEHGLAVNLGGGFHHAAADRGGGFCVYADIPIAARLLHDEGRLRTVLVVDLDAHQGNGVASIFRGWIWARILDVYEHNLFPLHKEPEDYPLPVPPGMTGSDYLEVVHAALPHVLDEVRPDLVVYNAGSDPFDGDPLTRLKLSANDLVDRDLLVVTEARDRGIPVAMVLSGGYSALSWKIHADAVEALLTRFDRA